MPIRVLSQLTALYYEFPYIATELVPTLYHVIPLSDTLDEAELRRLARYQAVCNHLPTCLVLDHARGIYLDSAGTEAEAPPPLGGIVVSGQLKPSLEVAHSAWWTEKSQRLNCYVEQQRAVRKGGFLFGDLTRGGRPASKEERRTLSGATENGIPRGLSQCPACGEWRGHCLDDRIRDNLITVSCRCENPNRCAACLRPLAERKLNANYYDVTEGRICHLPGFVLSGHQCPDDAGGFVPQGEGGRDRGSSPAPS